MPSLSELIFLSQKSPDKKPNESDENTTGSTRRRKNDHVNYLKENYRYDPIEDFYEESYTPTTARKAKITRTSPHHSPIPENTPNQRNEKSLHTPQTGTSQAKFDFQQNEDERNFFQSAQLQQQRQEQELKQQQSAKKKRKSLFDDETKEEYEERVRLKKLVSARRRRFRSRKYNFDKEIDYGGSVSTMVKYQMDVGGEFKRLKVDHDDGEESKQNKIDQSEIEKKSQNTKIEDEGTFELTDRSSSNEEMNGQLRGIMKHDDDNGASDSDTEQTRSDSSNDKHVLGSLLDRVQKQEQAIKIEDGSDDVGYEYGIAEMQQNPVSFEGQGYLAPLSNDPYANRYSYHNSSTSTIIRGIPANERFRTTYDQSRANFGRAALIKAEEVDHHLSEQKKLSSIGPTKQKVVSDNNVILPHFLPLNCFNTSMLALHVPRQCSDKYHYLPFSHQDPTSTRIVTSRATSVQQLHNSNEDSDFYTNKIKSFWPLHFHSKNINLIAARLIVSCAGLLSVDDDEAESTTNSLSEILSLLYRKQNTSSRTMVLIRLSQELASNYTLWKHMEKRVEELHARNFLLDEEYYFLRQELLSERSEMLTNEHVTTDTKNLKENTKQRRGRILKCITDLSDEMVNTTGELITSFDDENDSGVVASCPSYSAKNAENVKGVNELLNLTRGEKYSQAVHIADIDFDTIHLTLAVLFTELNNSSENNVHDTIIAYLETLSNMNWFPGHDPNKSGRFYKEALNAVHAKTVLLRQSYVANAGSYSNLGNRKNTSELSDDDIGEKNRKNSHGVQNCNVIGEKLFEIGSDLRGDSKLVIFTYIHMTTGIAALAKNMPSYAAEIISCPIISNKFGQQSAFDLMRRALEAIERNNHIVRKQSTGFIFGSDESITAESMITRMNQASVIFQECHDSDPHNLDCICWYVATKIGSMILGSGITIGDGPTLACLPEYMIESDAIGTKCRHRDYSEQRALASRAVRILMSYSKTTDESSSYHFALKNLLEWSEAMFLLAFRPTVNKNCIERIRSLHASHTITWAMKNPTVQSLNLLLHLFESELVAKRKILSFMSTLVEVDGASSRTWAVLAFSLGRIGSLDHQTCVKSDCGQCKRLNRGCLYHKKIMKQRNRKDWWGAAASKWWDSHFFICPTTQNVKRKDFPTGHSFYTNIAERLESRNQNKTPIAFLKGSTRKIKRNHFDLSWMWSDEPSEEDEEDQVEINSESDESTKRKSHLILPSNNAICDSNVFSTTDKLRNQLGDKLLIWISKILVACHLYGIDHIFVEESVKFLWVEFLRGKKDSVEFEALSILALQNLNVISYLSEMRSDIRKDNTPPKHFPFCFKTL